MPGNFRTRTFIAMQPPCRCDIVACIAPTAMTPQTSSTSSWTSWCCWRRWWWRWWWGRCSRHWIHQNATKGICGWWPTGRNCLRLPICTYFKQVSQRHVTTIKQKQKTPPDAPMQHLALHVMQQSGRTPYHPRPLKQLHGTFGSPSVQQRMMLLQLSHSFTFTIACNTPFFVWCELIATLCGILPSSVVTLSITTSPHFLSEIRCSAKSFTSSSSMSTKQARCNL